MKITKYSEKYSALNNEICNEIMSSNYSNVQHLKLYDIYCDTTVRNYLGIKCKQCIKCDFRASYNYIGHKPTYCKTHSRTDMVNTNTKKCKYCYKQPVYNIEGGPALYCKDHASPKMINVVASLCIEDGCPVRATFNFNDSQPMLYCSEHKVKGMICIMNKNCIVDKCPITPYYNFKGLPALYCKKHSFQNMINVKSKKCKYIGCEIIPSYNYVNMAALYCVEHKLDNMILVRNTLCENANCEKQACFNYADSKCGRFCSTHKLVDMINIYSKKCEKCEISANYNYDNCKIARFCASHKLDNMINVYNRLCEFTDCPIKPNYNYIGNKGGRFCNEHKLNDMINIYLHYCEDDECDTLANYNYENSKTGRFCATHRLENMVDIKTIKCKTPLCDVKASNKYKGYCFACFVYTFPDEPISRNYKTKERTVVDYVIDNFPSFTWIVDKKINDGCSNRRPDLLLDLGYHIIIVEIDEYQHDTYDISCENLRLMQISSDLGHRPIIFLRLNPDKYTIGNIIVPSCWGYNKKGLCGLISKNIEQWHSRLQALKERIEFWTKPENVCTKTVEIEKLFFDQQIVQQIDPPSDNNLKTSNVSVDLNTQPLQSHPIQKRRNKANRTVLDIANI